MKLAIVDDNEIEQEIILNTLNAYHKESGISLEIQSFFRRRFFPECLQIW